MTVSSGIVASAFEMLAYRIAKSFVVARAQLHLATALDCQGSVAVEFDFIQPAVAPWQTFGPPQEHRLDEPGFDLVRHALRVLPMAEGGGNSQAILDPRDG